MRSVSCRSTTCGFSSEILLRSSVSRAASPLQFSCMMLKWSVFGWFLSLPWRPGLSGALRRVACPVSASGVAGLGGVSGAGCSGGPRSWLRWLRSGSGEQLGWEDGSRCGGRVAVHRWQDQSSPDLDSLRRSCDVSSVHLRWCHLSQLQHRTESRPTLLPHFPHGYARGPGVGRRFGEIGLVVSDWVAGFDCLGCRGVCGSVGTRWGDGGGGEAGDGGSVAQLAHFHLVSSLAMRRRSCRVSVVHLLWCHFLQRAHMTELRPTFFPQTPQWQGPGLVSTSPALSSSRAR